MQEFDYYVTIGVKGENDQRGLIQEIGKNDRSCYYFQCNLKPAIKWIPPDSLEYLNTHKNLVSLILTAGFPFLDFLEFSIIP
eukprot:snap_masked-scaffold_11-processed-gene-6.36-mRNA-1 protein AED:1.00 eAED:1.00 QI:0/0/0/0/1/1/2/0/81